MNFKLFNGSDTARRMLAEREHKTSLMQDDSNLTGGTKASEMLDLSYYARENQRRKAKRKVKL